MCNILGPKVDCGKCSCGLSAAQHTPAYDEKNGMRYRTVCDHYY
jgi:hypothetical protein